MIRLNRRMLSAGVAAALCCAGASTVNGQCVTYTIAPGPATYTAGDTDLGLYTDDGTRVVALPFFVSLYGASFGSATVSTNGNIQFATASAAYVNNCLPTTTFAGPTIFALWDDLYTAGGAASGQGIFTRTTGVSPNQEFTIEWRVVDCCVGALPPVHFFCVKFYENATFFDVVYQTVAASGTDSTIGIQNSATGPASQFGCNPSGITSGTSLRFTCAATEPTGRCCTTGACAITAQSACLAPGTFTAAGVCDPNPCPQPGACCSTAGVCTNVLPSGCTGTSVFQGVGSACATTVCPGPGACCTTGGCCTSVLQGACLAPSTWTSGVACTPNPCTAPINDACADAIPLTLGVSRAGSNCSATDDATIACSTTTPLNTHKTVWYSFTPPASGYFDVNTCGSAFDTTLGIYTDCTFATEVASNDDAGTQATLCPLGRTLIQVCVPGGLQSRIPRVFLSSGTNYKIAVGAWGAAPAGGTFSVVVNTTVAGACCDANNACTIRANAATCVGAYRGDGTVCEPDPCNVSAGACCCGASCSLTTPDACAGANQAFTGAGTVCAPFSFTSPCCRANYNKSAPGPNAPGGVSVQDVFDYLTGFFGNDPCADANDSGGVPTVQDVFDYLTAFFGGC